MEGTLTTLSLIVAAVLRGVYVFHHRVNTDEPQHLHVGWAWAQGLLPYRDVFDNHSPLFSLLMAPVLHAIGERPDIVLLARLAMIPFTVLTLALTWVIGRRLYSGNVALLAVALVALAPDFMLGSVEYRTDQLWTALWMTAMALLLTGTLTRARSFLIGLAVGAALGASMKTCLLVLSFAAAGVATVYMLRPRGVKIGLASMASLGAPALAGMAVVPGILAAFFAVHGAWKPMLYCTLSHNMVSNLGYWSEGWYRAILLIVALPLLWVAGRRIVEHSDDPGLGGKRALLFLTAGGYYVLLQSVWPLVTRQDALPFLPMAAVAAGSFLTGLRSRVQIQRPRLAGLVLAMAFAPALVLALEIVWMQEIEPFWRGNDASDEISFIGEVLRLTRPGDPVMDLKGETIFRRRPFYYALETITQTRITDGLIRDDIPERLAATRTPVTVADTPDFPDRGRAFLNANYVRVGNLRVVGVALGPQDGSSDVPFTIGVPQRYAVICEHGEAAGLLDGVPYGGPRDLEVGRHRYRGHRSEGRVIVLWAEAVARVRSPFR